MDSQTWIALPEPQSRIQHQSFDMNTEPTSTEAPICTETVPTPAYDNTHPMSHSGADETNMPTGEEPTSTEAATCTESVPMPAFIGTRLISQPAAEEESLPADEAADAEGDSDEEDSTYSPSV